MEKNNKSKAKAMGVKSTFNINGNTVITTFGKGNNAIIEKEIENGVVSDVSEKQTIAVDVIQPRNKEFEVTKGRVSFPKENNPVLNQPQTEDVKIQLGDEALSYKEELEKKYFGKTFNDNIHIQLIHNILTLEKDLAIYSNTASFLVNNIFAVDSEDEDYDIFTYLNTSNTFEKVMNPQTVDARFRNNIIPINNKLVDLLDIRNNYSKEKPRRENPRLSYYGNVFYTKKGKLRSDEDIYNCFAILGNIRNFVTDSLSNERISAIIYNLNIVDNSFNRTLDNVIGEMVDSLNKSFINNNKTNYYILLSAYNCNDDLEIKNQLTGEFYDFTVKKSFKNMGFSIKMLRERIIENHRNDLKNKKYDSCRSKLYQLLDFAIYHYYLHHPEKGENNIVQLRATRREEDKEAFYAAEAKRLYREIKTEFDGIAARTTPTSISRIDPEEVNIFKDCIEMLDSTKFDYFSKMIYILTLFLDGKQINELLTSLIHSFDNINSFKNILNETGNSDEFVSPYMFFNHNRTVRIANELRIINSFARMKLNDPNYKKAQYIDAMVALGTDMNKEELSEEADRILAPKQRDHSVRNFLANNVLNSNRYKYLIRYIRPSMASAIASNKNIVCHVLKDIPEAQIKRYYDSVFMVHIVDKTKLDKNGGFLQYNVAPPKAPLKEMQQKLAEEIAIVGYDAFRNVKQKARNGSEDALDKERKKAVVRLYLTVVYIFVKNMVQVNSRYVIAFHCLERDSKFFGYDLRKKRTDSLGNAVYNKNYHYLTKAYINTANMLYNAELDKPFKERKKVKRPINQRFCRILCNDMEFGTPGINSKDEYVLSPELRASVRPMLENEKLGDNASLPQSVIREFRNNVAHLNLVRTLDHTLTLPDGRCVTPVSLLGEFKTYFEAYHFLMQLQICGSTQRCGNKRICEYEEMSALKDWLLARGRYSKNTVKTLCTPFGYNLIRYKNLSINELFDKNNCLPDKE